MKRKKSKRYKNIEKTSQKNKNFLIDEAIQLVKKNCNVKFDESIDVSFNLNLKQKKEEVSLRTNANLPHGNGKKVKVAVLCEETKSKEAKDSGAEFSNYESLIKDIENGKINFDMLVSTPAMHSLFDLLC